MNTFFQLAKQLPDRILKGGFIFIFGLSLQVLEGGQPTTSSGGAQSDGHARMVQLLAQIAARTPPGYPWVQDLEKARRDLSQEPQGLDLEKKVLARVSLARKERLLGNTQEAVDLFRQAYEMTPALPAAKRMGYLGTLTFDLGVSYMRLGENENCLANHTGDACILPLTSAARHRKQGGSRNAIPYFESIVRGTPKTAPIHISSKWLLNLAYMTLGEYPGGVPPDVLIDPCHFSSKVKFPRFRNVAPRLGLDVRDLAGGAVVEDLDNDGDLDILTSSFDVRGSLHLYRNNRDGSFTERTRQAGLTGLTGGLNLIQADYDNDGDVDILVLRGAWLDIYGLQPNSLLRNEGNLTFTDVTFEAGLGKVHYPTQTASWADYDNDGDLDLYVGNETTETQSCPSQLFRNEGDGTFVDVAREAGVHSLGWTKGVIWGDYNGDRFPDLYISNFQGNNRLYRNNRDGTFTDVAVQADVTGPRSSFPSWFWDFDNDGVLDLMVNSSQMPLGTGPPDIWYVAASHLGLSHPADEPSLYRGDGRGGFRDVAGQLGLKRATLPMGANFGDLDNDGYLDFYLGTGYPGLEGLVPNVMYWNKQGKAFQDVTYAVGFGHLQKGHGVAFADIDNDGDQDVFEQMGGFLPGDPYHNALFLNPGFGNQWITLELEGTRSSRSAIGARIRLELEEDGKTRSIYRWVNSGGTFGANPLRQEIGVGQAQRILRIQIDWPAGSSQEFQDVEVNQFLRVREGEKNYSRVQRQAFKLVGQSPGGGHAR